MLASSVGGLSEGAGACALRLLMAPVLVLSMYVHGGSINTAPILVLSMHAHWPTTGPQSWAGFLIDHVGSERIAPTCFMSDSIWLHIYATLAPSMPAFVGCNLQPLIGAAHRRKWPGYPAATRHHYSGKLHGCRSRSGARHCRG